MTLPTDLLQNGFLVFWIAVIAAAVIGLELVSRLDSIKAKQICIASISFALIGWMDIWSLLFLCVLSSGVIFIVKKKYPLQRIIYQISLAGIFFLIAIKDYRFILENETLYVPLGVSYYFFRLISFLIEYSRQPEKISSVSLIDYYSWVFFFPVFLSGPIIRFHELKPLSKTAHFEKKNFFYRNLVLAATAKIVIVDLMLFRLTYNSLYPFIIYKFSDNHYLIRQYLNLPYLSLFSGCAFFHAYLDLMLYTEISKAIAGILGFSNVDNFNRPLLASNISEFWQKWHMSLSNWTRDYVFFPMLIKTKNTWISIYSSMMVIGIWHSATLNWIVWAIMHATAINLYGQWRRTTIYQFMVKHPSGSMFLKIGGNIITVYFVMMVFSFVAIHDFKQVLLFFIRCF